MGDQDVGGIAAGRRAGTTQVPWTVAIILLTAGAGRAVATADPRINRAMVADLHALRVRSHGDHLAGDLVAQSVRQLHAGQRQLGPAAEVERALVDVDVAVADAAVLDPDQNLRPRGLRCRPLDGL